RATITIQAVECISEELVAAAEKAIAVATGANAGFVTPVVADAVSIMAFSSENIRLKRKGYNLPFKPEPPPFSFDEAKIKYELQFKKLGYEPISKVKIQHIFNKHHPSGSKYKMALAKKFQKMPSVFDKKENFIELTLEALKKGNKVEKSKVVYDFGRIIGKDSFGNKTSIIKVILDESNKIVKTCFPISI
ncbi:hypothetical protein KAH94_06385, partial [bacterium]|nr:hypothetical protein [bacterium]